jgi:hypothetical protein
MTKKVITEETLPSYLEYIKQNYSNNVLKLTDDNNVATDGSLFTGYYENINGSILSLSSADLDIFFIETEEFVKSNEDMYQIDTSKPSLTIITAGNSITFYNSSINFYNIPTTPLGLEAGTLYVSGGYLRIV